MNKPSIIVFEDTQKLSEYFVKQWASHAIETIARSGRFCCAFSGGRTPVEFYSLLSAFNEFRSWSKVHIFLTDERFVNESDKDNNFRLIKDNLLRHISIPPENVHPIPTDAPTVGVAAEEYKNILLKYFTLDKNHLPVFDLMLLGLGEDGHTASLFPDTVGMDDRYRLTLPVTNSHLKYDRISLTLPVINNSRHVYFIVAGRHKANIVREIIEEKKDYPASKVNPTQGTLTFLMDVAAAGLLKNPKNYIPRTVYS
ncbi:MAG: 6-phosphogluconolactonase [Candidatus Omnitrophica bacterium]|nr:6-phosphogluconolactonase [Candidatus Omnitrophota bacterium]